VIGYPGGLDDAILSARDYPFCPARKKVFFLHLIIPSLTKLVRSKNLTKNQPCLPVLRKRGRATSEISDVRDLLFLYQTPLIARPLSVPT